MLENKKVIFYFVLIIALLAVVSRFLPHIPNTAPIAALSLFVGMHLRGTWKIVIPLAVMILTDYFVGFYDPRIMISVYGSFLLILATGHFLKAGKSKVLPVIGGSLAGSTLFFVITNAAVWLFSGLYTQTFSGIILCYVLALPFFGYALLGDILWNITFSKGYALFRRAFAREVRQENIEPSLIV